MIEGHDYIIFGSRRLVQFMHGDYTFWHLIRKPLMCLLTASFSPHYNTLNSFFHPFSLRPHPPPHSFPLSHSQPAVCWPLACVYVKERETCCYIIGWNMLYYWLKYTNKLASPLTFVAYFCLIGQLYNWKCACLSHCKYLGSVKALWNDMSLLWYRN